MTKKWDNQYYEEPVSPPPLTTIQQEKKDKMNAYFEQWLKDNPGQIITTEHVLIYIIKQIFDSIPQDNNKNTG